MKLSADVPHRESAGLRSICGDLNLVQFFGDFMVNFFIGHESRQNMEVGLLHLVGQTQLLKIPPKYWDQEIIACFDVGTKWIRFVQNL